ncbi:unnamed protein product [Microthlaspi erraticum]|uniref:Uncharacterized protein n=1 Tax=Microthlaspi erraticum TaxID=1685480 RepID=A0A6D2IHU6_9BRAS|nr:unnamed protein product [Microthlaspi erraticum]
MRMENSNQGEEKMEGNKDLLDLGAVVKTVGEAEELARRLFMSNLTDKEHDMIVNETFSPTIAKKKVMTTSRLIYSDVITNDEIHDATITGIEEALFGIKHSGWSCKAHPTDDRKTANAGTLSEDNKGHLADKSAKKSTGPFRSVGKPSAK